MRRCLTVRWILMRDATLMFVCLTVEQKFGGLVN